MSVSLNANVASNLRAIQNTTAQLAITQSRLATGKKVNTALDNPASFFTASSMTSKAAALGNLMDNFGKGLSAIKSADEGIKSISKLIDSAKAAVAQAQGSSSAVSERTTLEGSTVTGLTATDLVNVGGTANGLDGQALTVTNSSSGESVSVTFGADANEVNTLAALNESLATVGAVASVADNRITITSTGSAEGSTFSLVGAGAQTAFGATDATTAVTTSDVEFEGSGAASRRAAAAEFNKLMTQIQQTSNDSGVNGLNLLAGDKLKINFNEAGTSNFEVEGVAMNAAHLGLDDVSADDFLSAEGLESITNKLTAAGNTLTAQASSFGTSLSIVETRKGFTEAMVGILNEGAGALVNADLNEEAANALALQTRLTLSQTALSISTQTEQSVLRMIG